MTRKILLSLLFLTTILIVYGKDTLQTKSTMVTSKVLASIPDDISPTAYKLLYENQKETNDKILQTVYWSLGGILGVLLLIIGSNIYFNVRFNKKEVELITTELLNKLEDAKNIYLLEISQKIEISSIELRKTIELEKQELSKTYQELLKSYSDNFHQQINSLKESNEEKAKLLTKQIERTERMTDQQNDRIKNSIDRETKLLKRDILKNDAEIWLLKDLPTIALTSYIRLAKLDFEINYDWAFQYTSDDIIKCLSKVESLSPDNSAELNAVLDIAVEKYKTKTDKIKELLKDKPIKKLRPYGLLGGLLGGEL